jgi:hypothetical protein
MPSLWKISPQAVQYRCKKSAESFAQVYRPHSQKHTKANGEIVSASNASAAGGKSGALA